MKMLKVGDIARNKHIRANFTPTSPKRRALSALLITVGFWQSITTITNSTGFAEFFETIWKPAPLMGLGLALAGGLLTSGAKEDK